MGKSKRALLLRYNKIKKTLQYIINQIEEMRFLETHFDDYIQSLNQINIHPKMKKVYDALPVHFKHFKNIILYGPPGVGKYTQMLKIVSKYSSSELKYEKKITISYLKQQYVLKISDIHYEVDMSQLGCNSKLLWHEIYVQIIDIISAKISKHGVIVCKNFQDIHGELLENYYSYMQTTYANSVNIKFILITESISFIPDNIVSYCRIVHVPRPSKTMYEKCIDAKLPVDINLVHVKNIKTIKCTGFTTTSIAPPHKIICDKIICSMIDLENVKYLKFRDSLYDAFIINLDIPECIWYIVTELINRGLIPDEKLVAVFKQVYTFFQYYNNNYRPIYHLEHFLLYLSAVINGVSVNKDKEDKEEEDKDKDDKEKDKEDEDKDK